MYCDRVANGPLSIARDYFDNHQGNIKHRIAQHVYGNDDKCVYCGVRAARGAETPVYPFIHPDENEHSMHFNLIIGNPPYQIKDGGHGASASPLYQRFVDQSLDLHPDHLVMVIPARWYTDGKGLDQFRDDMLTSKRIAELVDFPNSRDCFPDNDIPGGICVFRWSKDHDGPTSIKRHYLGRIKTEDEPRYLDSGRGMFVRTVLEASILDQVALAGEDCMDEQVSSRNPFDLPTKERGNRRGGLHLRHSAGESKWSRNKLVKGLDMVDSWKVIVSRASGAAKSRDNEGRKSVLSVLEILEPKSVCTDSYLVAGAYESKTEAQRLVKYLDTKFVRYLIGICGESQTFSRSTFRFVPNIGHLDNWTDEMLFDRYDLTDEQRAEIQQTIKPRVNTGEY